MSGYLIPGLVIGNYRIERLIGVGATGSVYLAIHLYLPVRVAIKVLHSHPAQYAERFIQEAHAISCLRHPGLVNITETGTLPDGTAYIVMELLHGLTLAQDQAHRGRPLGTEALGLARQIASVLTATHQIGIVHGDINPNNVMIVDDPEAPGGKRAKVLDFGSAKLLTDGEHQTFGSLMGMPLYMAPELCRGASVDGKADVYSLGVMLYQMLSGQLPFRALSLGEMLAQHLFEPPLPLHTVAPDLPASVVELVEHMLVKDRQTRPTMAEVATRIEELIRKPTRDPHPHIVPVGNRESLTRGMLGTLLAGLSIVAIIYGVAPYLKYWLPGGTSDGGVSGLAHSLFKRLLKGGFAVDAPLEIRQGQGVLISARAAIGEVNRAQLEEGFKHDNPQVSVADLGLRVKVELKPDSEEDFTVKPLSPLEQDILPPKAAIWQWTVTPKRPGDDQILRVLATNVTDIDGKAITSAEPVKTIIVRVLVNPEIKPPEVPPWRSLWGWGVGTLAVAGGAAAWMMRRRRRPVSTNGSTLAATPPPARASTPAPEVEEKTDIFISYHPMDKQLRDKLMTHLAPLKRMKWHDGLIKAGCPVPEQVRLHMDQAQVIVILVSPEYLEEKTEEMDRALDRQKRENVKVVPVIGRPAAWKKSPLKDLQPLPPDGMSVEAWSSRDEACLQVVEGIRAVLPPPDEGDSSNPT